MGLRRFTQWFLFENALLAPLTRVSPFAWRKYQRSIQSKPAYLVGRKGPDLSPRVQPRQPRYENWDHVLAVDDLGTAHRRPRHSCTAHVRVPTISVPLVQK